MENKGKEISQNIKKKIEDKWEETKSPVQQPNILPIGSRKKYIKRKIMGKFFGPEEHESPDWKGLFSI